MRKKKAAKRRKRKLRLTMARTLATEDHILFLGKTFERTSVSDIEFGVGKAPVERRRKPVKNYGRSGAEAGEIQNNITQGETENGKKLRKRKRLVNQRWAGFSKIARTLTTGRNGTAEKGKSKKDYLLNRRNHASSFNISNAGSPYEGTHHFDKVCLNKRL